MDTTEYLGPFRNLSNYRDLQVRLNAMQTQPAEFTNFGKVWSFDFDIRPQRTCLSNGRHLRLAQYGADWNGILTRAIWSVARTLGLVGDVEKGIEGECDDGTVTCWVRTDQINATVLRKAKDGMAARLLRQNWPDHHPDCVLSSLFPNWYPGRDRVAIQIADPQTRHSVPMLAENFYFVNQQENRVDAYALNEWDTILSRLQEH